MANDKLRSLDVGLLILRVIVGVIFLYHGVGKLLGPGPEGFAAYLASAGIPQPEIMSYAAIAAEIGGGLLVLLGLFARLGALLIVAIMLVAIFKIHLPNGFGLVISATLEEFQKWPEGPGGVRFVPHGIEYPLVHFCLSLGLVFTGPGRIALFAGGKES